MVRFLLSVQTLISCKRRMPGACYAFRMDEPVQVRRGAAKKTAAEPRTNDPDRTMADILKVATAEFADKGLSGARIDEIAAATRTSKRMIGMSKKRAVIIGRICNGMTLASQSGSSQAVWLAITSTGPRVGAASKPGPRP